MVKSANNMLGVGTLQMKKTTQTIDNTIIIDPPDQESNSFTPTLTNITLLDPDVLDCPICTEHLTIPVFQCKSGHMLCSTCCINVKNECPSCSTQIDIRCRPIEKVLESLQMPCQNSPDGCREILLYSKKRIHEERCQYLPCSCPLPICNFVGTLADLANHCRSHDCFKKIKYDSMNYVVMDTSKDYNILQEEKEGNIFILRNKRQHNVHAFSVSCIGNGPNHMNPYSFSYDLIDPSSLRLKAITNIVQGLPTGDTEDLTHSLIIPRDGSSNRIHLLLWIWKDEEQPCLLNISSKGLDIEPTKKPAGETSSKIKKPMGLLLGAYCLFMEEYRKLYKENHPDNRSIGIINKTGGSKWRSMTESEKAFYVAKAESRKAALRRK